MKNKFFTAVITLGTAAVMLTACSKVPQAEIDVANAAIIDAKLAGADIYMHESYVALQDSMNGVMAYVEKQSSRVFKSYSKAKEHLAGVQQFAQEVQQETELRKEEMKAEILATIDEVKALIEANRQLILEAPKGKEGTSALVEIRGEIDAIEVSLNEITPMIDNADYIPALDKVKAAKEKAGMINTELSEVIAKYKSNVKGRKV
ncbi:MAG: hypothetical protein V2I47_12950 [Bacteroidales bacterium]|nr:hypothetical protein [Bacteroidales bacterium]